MRTGSNKNSIQQPGAGWMQARKHDTEEMFKLSLQWLGSTGKAAGVTNDAASDVGKSDKKENPREQRAKSVEGLESWIGKSDHKVAVGGQAISQKAFPWEQNESEALNTNCKRFDHSILQPQHGCQVNKDTLNMFCNFDNLRIDNSKIDVAQGGETLSSVMGRKEYVELPKYQRGAFALQTKPNYQVPKEYRSKLHYLQDVLNSIRYPTEKNDFNVDVSCDETFPGITLFTTRYEYVNLYHTLTDWWSAFFVLPEDYFEKPHRVVFLDGHAQGGLDDVWKVLFGDFYFIQHLSKGKGLCFERAVFIPAGYKAPLFPDFERVRCPRKDLAAAFSDFVLGQYNLQSVSPTRGNVVIIDRQPYISHPRSDASKFQRKSSNNDMLKSELDEIPGVNVQLARMEELSFGQQLKLVREAHFLIGLHGAALSHLMFMDRSKSHVLEFSPTSTDFFKYLSEWKGIHHKLIYTDPAFTVSAKDIAKAVNFVRDIMV
jgi:glycoprotein 2-beta-D-xylosyltransferase